LSHDTLFLVRKRGVTHPDTTVTQACWRAKFWWDLVLQDTLNMTLRVQDGNKLQDFRCYKPIYQVATNWKLIVHLSNQINW